MICQWTEKVKGQPTELKFCFRTSYDVQCVQFSLERVENKLDIKTYIHNTVHWVTSVEHIYIYICLGYTTLL